MHLAWHIAALMRTGKKFPKLDKLMVRRRPPRQTMAQQIALAGMWSALGYGKIKRAD